MSSVIENQKDIRDFSLLIPKVGDQIMVGDTKKATIVRHNGFPWGFNIIAEDEDGEIYEFREQDLRMV